MSGKVFISGSISIKHIPEKVKESLGKISQGNLTALIGDADGIDILIQRFFKNIAYYNVKVYSIYTHPRNLATKNFETESIFVSQDIKSERDRQAYKDAEMSKDCDYNLVIWDGKSKGSYNNILRAIEQKKPVKVYLSTINDFLPQNQVNANEIQYIFYENNGYTAAEVVEYLKEDGCDFFKNTRELNKYLLDNNILTKIDGAYKPISMQELFLIEKYKGKETGIKFKNPFIDWIKNSISKSNSAKQDDLF